MRNDQYSHAVLGVTIHNYSMQQILEIVYSKLTADNPHPPRKPLITPENHHSSAVLPLYTINPEILVLASKCPYYKMVLNHAFIAVPDGVGILIAGLLRRKSLTADRRGFSNRITGIELVSELTKLASEHDFKVGFL